MKGPSRVRKMKGLRLEGKWKLKHPACFHVSHLSFVSSPSFLQVYTPESPMFAEALLKAKEGIKVDLTLQQPRLYVFRMTSEKGEAKYGYCLCVVEKSQRFQDWSAHLKTDRSKEGRFFAVAKTVKGRSTSREHKRVGSAIPADRDSESAAPPPPCIAKAASSSQLSELIATLRADEAKTPEELEAPTLVPSAGEKEPMGAHPKSKAKNAAHALNKIVESLKQKRIRHRKTPVRTPTIDPEPTMLQRTSSRFYIQRTKSQVLVSRPSVHWCWCGVYGIHSISLLKATFFVRLSHPIPSHPIPSQTPLPSLPDDVAEEASSSRAAVNVDGGGGGEEEDGDISSLLQDLCHLLVQNNPVIVSPRCYCLTSKVPYHALHFQTLCLIVAQAQAANLQVHTSSSRYIYIHIIHQSEYI